MSMFKRRMIILALGVLSGVAAWPVMELLLGLQQSFPGYLLFSLVSGAALGLIYGSFFGTADGIIAGRWFRIFQGMATGAGIGFLGGALGFLAAQGLFMLLGEIVFSQSRSVQAWALPLSRSVGWALLGMFVGMGEGLRALSLRKALIGLLGGFSGGLLGGLILEGVGYLSPGSAVVGLIGLVVFGACIGLAYGLVERNLSYGVLRLLNGRFKGKEFILNQRKIRVGSDSRCDVLLEGYQGVEAVHALIHLRRGELFLEPAEQGGTIVVNDDLTDQRLLKFDDVVKIGRAKLFFKQVLVLVALVLPLWFVNPSGIYAQEVTISQIDTSKLLTRQEVGIFLSIQDNQGFPVERLGTQELQVSESADGKTFIPVSITGFNTYSPSEQGIDFYLLVDNSGSMYETITGQPTEDPRMMRITLVKDALLRFLDNLAQPRDRAGLYTFNTHITALTSPTEDINFLRQTLEGIQRPARADGYTELYAAISQLAGGLESGPRRRVIIVLSDGENLPFRQGEGKPHPIFGDREYLLSDGIHELQRAGVSLFSIGFGPVWEQSLVPLSRQAGGRVYNASNTAELAGIYQDIRQRVIREYSLTYQAAMIPSKQRIVRVQYQPNGSGTVTQVQRSYFSGTLLGVPSGLNIWIALGALLFALGLWLLLTRLRFINRWNSANLEVLGGGSTKMFPLGPDKTIIGSSATDDVTLVGSPNTRPHHATVVFDPTKHRYTVLSEDGIRVNNKKTLKRDLESGDVIDLGGTLVVFDEPEVDDASKK